MDGKLKATSELKNGLQNGLSIIYDETGKVKWKIEMVNGKRHGLAWFKDIGEKYYIMDKESTKEEFEAYQRH
jgi:antitoxin component YwqK of YwqJK toxin-antitoxin module